MEVTRDKCNGCIYYTKINTYTTSPSTTRDELVEKYGAYYTCSKPYLVICPRESDCVVETLSSIIAKRCAICGNSIEFVKNSDEIICNECKNAMKRLKERLENETRRV